MIHKRTKLMLPLLVATLVCQAQTYFPLTGNGDGTWTLTSMPAYNVKIEVEYADVAFTAPTAKDGLTYTGEAQQLINAGVSEDGTMKYSLDGENFSEEIPTATLPGTYTVYYKIVVNNVSSEVESLTSTIAKATYALTNNGDGTWMINKMRPYNVRVEVEYEDMVFTAPTAKDGLAYTGEAQQLINAGTSEDGTIKYSLDGENFSEEIPTATLPGTYTVYYKIVVNNVSSQVGSLTSTIAKVTYALTNNGDGTWTLDQMPDYNVKLVVEYEDGLSQAIDLTNNGDGTWTLDQMPDYNVKLVVEYMDEATDISLADNASNAETLNAYNGETVNVTLDGRTLYKDGKWNTLTLPFDVSSLTGTPLEGATIMEMNTAKKNGFDAASGTLYLAFKTATQIEAGKPYLVKWTNGADIVEPVFSDVTISSTTPTAIESATSGLETVRMVGNYAPVTVKADDQSIMFMGDDNSLYYSSEDRTLRNFRAHFEIPSQQSAPALAHRFVIDFDGDEVVSGIDGIRIVNSDYTDGWYSLDGRLLNSKPLAKGVYIHNGNKVIVK